MECTKCGAEIEADSKFCSRCAAPVLGAHTARSEDDGDHVGDDDEDADEDADEDDEADDDQQAGEDDGDRDTRARASAPASGPGAGAKVAGVVLGLAMIVLGILRLTNRPSIEIVPIEPPDLGYGASGAAGAPIVVPRDAPPERAPSESERALAGTWVATVGFDAPRPASMGSTLVQIQALRSGLSEPTQRCIWLELYDNLRGFQHECGVVDGEASVLQRTDPVTGRSSPLGVAFRWSFEDGRLSLTYDEDMVVAAGGQTLRFVRSVLTLPRAGSPPFDVQQSFPEHPDAAPLAQRFDVFAGSYLGE